jgi:hypothetical protein
LQTVPGGQTSAPAGELGSHSSLGSFTPSPQSADAVVVVVELVLVVVLVECCVVVVVVVVVPSWQLGACSVTWSLCTSRAKNAPVRLAPLVRKSSLLGAHTTALAVA